MDASMLRRMDAAQALADLTEISSQVVQVAIVDRDGSVLATTIPDRGRAERFVASVGRLLTEAETLAQSRGLSGLSQIEATTLDGSVFAVRRDGRLIVATTRPDPTVGLVFYDLKHCLGSVGDAAAAAASEDDPAPRAAKGPAPSAKPGGATRQARKKADTSA
jgi:predicted regulator of Ras-like GTPase activity (Roadblock/LC7/MglB family)